MLDEMDRLRNSNHLFQLLTHYAQCGKEDRQVWHDRLLDFDGIQGRELARLYGELIAHGWLEQNTGLTPVLEVGRFASCYRITAVGLRAHKQVRQQLIACTN